MAVDRSELVLAQAVKLSKETIVSNVFEGFIECNYKGSCGFDSKQEISL